MKLEEPLKKEEQQLLFEEYRRDKDPMVREKLILHNLRFVMWVAKQYYNPDKGELDDLFQVGTIGLMKAIEGYDPDKGSFGNYAMWWIRQSIMRDIANNGRTIRVPVHMNDLISSLVRARNQLMQTLEREPTTEELSFEMDLDIEEVEKILNVVNDPISLNTIVGGEDEDLTLEHSVADDSPTPDVVIGDKIFMEQIKAEIKPRVSELQYNILTMYYGLDGEMYTLKAIAEKYNYNSREYIRSERDKALREIRKTRFFMEIKKEVDERTSYIRGVDYSQPWSKGGVRSSPVERLVLNREKIREKLLMELGIEGEG